MQLAVVLDGYNTLYWLGFFMRYKKLIGLEASVKSVRQALRLTGCRAFCVGIRLISRRHMP